MFKSNNYCLPINPLFFKKSSLKGKIFENWDVGLKPSNKEAPSETRYWKNCGGRFRKKKLTAVRRLLQKSSNIDVS